jgi:ribonuclease R
MIQTVLLRSLKRAVYAEENNGHFGLALECYAHFTSPIRRYPDLLVHRAIKHVVSGQKPKNFRYSKSEMQRLGEQCSIAERRADEATWDVTGWLKCEYMMDKLGEQFNGIVTTVTGFGLFIELDDIYVEGLIHVTALENDYYHFDSISHCLIGESSGQCYRIGDRVRVQVSRVDLDNRKIDFALIEVLESNQEFSNRKLASVRKGKKKKGGRRETGKSRGKGDKKVAKKGKKTAMRKKQRTRARKS